MSMVSELMDYAEPYDRKLGIVPRISGIGLFLTPDEL